jgi:hypothetical protein
MNLRIGRKLDLTEEEVFAELHHFLLRKNNRVLSNDEVIEKTGISPELLYKWVKSGKLKRSLFPNLGAPCERCGKITNYAKICLDCSTSITTFLDKEEKDKEWFKQIQQMNRLNTYHHK